MEEKQVEKIDWLLATIKLSGGYIEGAIKLQKLTFLLHEMVPELKRANFYNDWAHIENHPSPYSATLNNDLNENTGSLITKLMVNGEAGNPVERFGLSQEGERRASMLIDAIDESNPKILRHLESVVNQYARMPLMDLAFYVYYNYPQYEYGAHLRKSNSNRQRILV